jgi:DNA invertase Pin-like site-specific DNA recombinase
MENKRKLITKPSERQEKNREGSTREQQCGKVCIREVPRKGVRFMHAKSPRGAMSPTFLIPAAQYLRMSTDHQQYSLQSQATAIQRYAEVHGFTLVQTYEDAGRSGLSLKRRNGLARLLHDVVSGGQQYNAILVYDVSRWGRFQDADEAAHYEFVCKSAGVPVHYCAETFTNDGTLASTIMKALKRAMAGEYSRELSVKIDRAKRLVAELGFRAGGAAGYGLRRMLLSANGTPKRLLEIGEIVTIDNGRVILVHGPAKEVALVREIYRLTISEKKSTPSIAREFNRRHIKHPGRLSWSDEHILEILTNPKYIGHAVYGRTTSILGSRVVAAPHDDWVVKVGAFDPIIDAETFAAAQRVLHSRTFYQSNEQLLDRLRLLLSREGTLTGHKVDTSRDVPATRTYIERFGSMKRAYDLIGYVYPERALSCPKLRKIMWRTRLGHDRLRQRLLRSICKLFPGEISVVRKEPFGRPILHFREGLRVAVVVCPFSKTPLGHLRWNVPALRASQSPVTLLCRCNTADNGFHDLYLVPSGEKLGWVRIKESDQWLNRGKRLSDLSKLRHAAEFVQKASACAVTSNVDS